MTQPTDLLKPEVLAAQGTNLDDAQEEAIRELAVRERVKKPEATQDAEEEEVAEEVDPWKAKLEEDAEAAEAEKTDEGEAVETDAEKAAKEAEEQAKAEAEAQAAAEAEKQKRLEEVKKKAETELSEEEKVLLKEDADAKAEARSAEIDKKAADYATKFGLGDEQAKKEVGKIFDMAEKYGKDPIEMAQALYHANAKLSQVSAQLKQVSEKPLPDELVLNGKKLSKQESDEMLVEMYRKHYPDISEDLDDEKVAVLARKELLEKTRQINEQRAIELKTSAESRRKQLIDSLPENEKKFAGDLKTALARVSDSDIVAEDFSVEDYMRWSRGRYYHQDIKEAEARGEKRALANKKIVQVRAGETGGSGGGGSAPKGKSGAITLSDEQKERALQMYDGQPLTDEQKYEMFIEFEKSKLPVKKK
jgi:hypothetical protein